MSLPSRMMRLGRAVIDLGVGEDRLDLVEFGAEAAELLFGFLDGLRSGATSSRLAALSCRAAFFVDAGQARGPAPFAASPSRSSACAGRNRGPRRTPRSCRSARSRACRPSGFDQMPVVRDDQHRAGVLVELRPALSARRCRDGFVGSSRMQHPRPAEGDEPRGRKCARSPPERFFTTGSVSMREVVSPICAMRERRLASPLAHRASAR